MPAAVSPSSASSSSSQSASRLRDTNAAHALSSFASLTRSAAELAQLIEALEDDIHRSGARSKQGRTLQSEVGMAIAAERDAQQGARLRAQAEALRQALTQLRRELADAAHTDIPAAQREALDEELAREEAVTESLHEQLLELSGESLDAVSRSRAAGASTLQTQALAHSARVDRGPGRAADQVVVEGLMGDASLDEGTVDAAPPAELSRGLQSFRRDIASLAKTQRSFAAMGSGTAPTDTRVAEIVGRWASWSQEQKAPQLMDPNEMTQWVMRQAYVDNSADMRTYAYKMRFQTELKSHLRDELQRAREHRSQHGSGSDSDSKLLTTPFDKKRIRRDPLVRQDGMHLVRAPEGAGEIVDVDGLNDYIRDMETALSTTSDDMMVANLELQSMSQRQQQVMNSLSSLSKALHETSMAILRKIGN